MSTRESAKASSSPGKDWDATSTNSSTNSQPPMAYRVKIMPRAERDLADIYQRIEASTSDASLTWYRGLRDALRALRNSPNRCPVTPEDRELRHLLYGDKPHIY